MPGKIQLPEWISRYTNTESLGWWKHQYRNDKENSNSLHQTKARRIKCLNKLWLLICDVFKGQWTETVKNVVKESNGKMVSVPNNWTNYFQPLDLTVNKSSKDFLRKEAQSWYSQEIVKQMEARKRSDQIKVDVRVCGETAGCKMDRQVLWLRKNQTPAHNQWLERVRHHWSSCKKDWFGPFFFIVMIIILIYHSFLK